MTEMTRIVAEVPLEMASLIEAEAASRHMSPSDYVAEALRQMTESDANYRAFIQEGIDAIDRGEYYTQEEMEAWFGERVAARRR